jgi:hypothetical protein
LYLQESAFFSPDPLQPFFYELLTKSTWVCKSLRFFDASNETNSEASASLVRSGQNAGKRIGFGGFSKEKWLLR